MILVENNGGDMNGTTTEDRTNYFESFAANQLDLGLFLEADRMRSLAINQANLDNQRNAVQEERRLGVDNQPYGKTSEVLQATRVRQFRQQAFGDRVHAGSERRHRQGRAGFLPHLLRAQQRGADPGWRLPARRRRWRRSRSTSAAFQRSPRRPFPIWPSQRSTASGARPSRIRLREVPRLDIAFKTPPGNTNDWYALDVVSDALGGGPILARCIRAW